MDFDKGRAELAHGGIPFGVKQLLLAGFKSRQFAVILTGGSGPFREFVAEGRVVQVSASQYQPIPAP